jgi:hypothetical protein
MAISVSVIQSQKPPKKPERKETMPSNSAQIRLHELGFTLDGSLEPKKGWDKLWDLHVKGEDIQNELWELIWRMRLRLADNAR